MGNLMAGKVRYLIQRDGRYHARIVVPPALRKQVGKVELSAALGPDRKAALRALPAVVARFQEKIAAAARRALPAAPLAFRVRFNTLGAFSKIVLKLLKLLTKFRFNTSA